MKYENYTMDECDGDGYCVNTAHLHLGKSAFCNVCKACRLFRVRPGMVASKGRSVTLRTRLREIMHDEEEEEYSIYIIQSNDFPTALSKISNKIL